MGDKIAHLGLYGVLGATLAYGRIRSNASVGHVALIGVGLAYGMTDEWHQFYVPGRSPDPIDWLADAAGVVAGYGTALGVLGRTGDGEADSGETRGHGG
ncbi:MAG: VanZ family protein [Gemmatimonadota bacterium]|nr:VanZ family protein [Gemmatimonadota bacterium]